MHFKNFISSVMHANIAAYTRFCITFDFDDQIQLSSDQLTLDLYHWGPGVFFCVFLVKFWS